MTDQTGQDILKHLLLDADRLEQLSAHPDSLWLREHAALCRKAAFCMKGLLDSQAQFSEEEGGLLRELMADEVLELQAGAEVYIVHDGKGSWKDAVTEIMSFLDIHDIKLDGGACLPMEEYGTKWRIYRLNEE